MYKDHFIVCGLGGLGQHCVLSLRELGVTVVAIAESLPGNWRFPQLRKQLDGLIEGDCTQPDVLAKAGLSACRGILLVTGDDHTNISAALRARRGNPTARLVVRSGQSNLNRLLAEQLGNFAAFEPRQISADAFALAALGSETVALFRHDEHWLGVIDTAVDEHDDWAIGLSLSSFNNEQRLLLRHEKAGAATTEKAFHNWDPNARIEIGDQLVYLERAEGHGDRSPQTALHRRLASLVKKLVNPLHWYDRWRFFWRQSAERQSQRVGLILGLTVLFLLLSGSLLFYFFYPHAAFHADFFAVTVLLLGGYGDMFGTFDETDAPDWLQAYSLFLSLVGIAIVGVLYALVTEFLLRTKFQFVPRRPAVPQRDHIVIIGVESLGQRVSEILRRLRQPLTCIATDAGCDRTILPKLPLLIGKPEDLLERANIDKARSVVVTTGEEIRNLEIGLMVRAVNTDCQLVIRAHEPDLSEDLAALLPRAEVISANSVAASVFASSAIGERIQGLFQLRGKTILISQHNLPADSRFCGRSLGHLAQELRVVPVALSRGEAGARLFPSEDTLLEADDGLVILATIAGLQRIEDQATRQARPQP